MPPAIVPAAGEGATGLCNIFLLAIKHLAIFGAFIDGFYALLAVCASVCARRRSSSFMLPACVKALRRNHLAWFSLFGMRKFLNGTEWWRAAWRGRNVDESEKENRKFFPISVALINHLLPTRNYCSEFVKSQRAEGRDGGGKGREEY